MTNIFKLYDLMDNITGAMTVYHQRNQPIELIIMALWEKYIAVSVNLSPDQMDILSVYVHKILPGVNSIDALLGNNPWHNSIV